MKAHDIGLRMVRDDAGAPGYEVIVGGGLGRTPMIGKVVRVITSYSIHYTKLYEMTARVTSWSVCKPPKSVN